MSGSRGSSSCSRCQRLKVWGLRRPVQQFLRHSDQLCLCTAGCEYRQPANLATNSAHTRCDLLQDDQGRTIGVVGGTSGPTATVAVPVGPTSAAGVDPEADATATCPVSHRHPPPPPTPSNTDTLFVYLQPPVTVTVIAGNPPPASSASENVPGDVSSASSAVAAPTPSPVSGSNGSTVSRKIKRLIL